MLEIKKNLGEFYHPILHKIRNSPCLHVFAVRKMLKKSIYQENRKPRLYVDITNLRYKDNGSGIARVTKEISARIVKFNEKYDVICIYNKKFDGYFDSKSDRFITFSRGDIYFGLDDSLNYCFKYDRLYKKLIKHNIHVIFFFHDLIPIRFPELCKRNICKHFRVYLKKIVNYSGIICNSCSTKTDLESWLKECSNIKRNKKLSVGYSLLGCDFSSENNYSTKEKKNDKLSFLMVATVEPKKKYDQAVMAFDILWKNGIDAELIIVGRRGWKSEKVFNMIENNKEYGKRLFWYNSGISDLELAGFYKNSTAVIMASVTEGFGLSVLEAARFKKPLILRNIPSFKEIAGENAFYFDGLGAQDLASSIESWIMLYKKNRIPTSTNIKLRTWDDCTKDVYKFLVGETVC